jgi:hypothetical protein
MKTAPAKVVGRLYSGGLLMVVASWHFLMDQRKGVSFRKVN